MRILKATLICCTPNCDVKEVPVTLLRNSVGVIQVNTFLCGECLGEVTCEITNEQADDYRSSGDSGKVGEVSTGDTEIQGDEVCSKNATKKEIQSD